MNAGTNGRQQRSIVLHTYERPLSQHKQGICRNGPAAGLGAIRVHASRSAEQQQLTCVPERNRNECGTNVQKLLQHTDADGLFAAWANLYFSEPPFDAPHDGELDGRRRSRPERVVR